VNEQVKLPPDTASIGKAIRKPEKGQRAPAHRASHHNSSDLRDPLHHVQVLQMGFADYATVAIAPVAVVGSLDHWHPFQCFLGVGFLALFGVSVQTGVIMLEYINQLRRGAIPLKTPRLKGGSEIAAIMMTMLVATLGLLPAALSHAIGRTRSVRSPS